ncbi:MAG: ABC transporter substrate-binding protein [Candidatus Omnitrophota bacterium]
MSAKSIIRTSVLLILSCFLTASSQAEEKTVNVLQSGTLAPYAEAFSGFKDRMKTLGYQVNYNVMNLREGSGSGIAERIKQTPADMILAIGTEAALLAKNKVGDRPLVFMMVLNPVENGVIRSFSRPGEGLTGVSLDIPIEEQFKVFKKVVPGIRKIGMIYDKRNKAALAREASIIAEKMGLRLVSKPVLSDNEIHDALGEVYREAECLWAAPDPMIYNPVTARNILRFTLENKMPFMAFSLNFVKAGALLALDRDYKDIGRQTAELTSGIFKGQSPSSIPVQGPRKTRLAINIRTARILDIHIPASLQEEALIFGE